MAYGDCRPVGEHALVESPSRSMVCVALIDDCREEAAVYRDDVRQGIAQSVDQGAHKTLPTALIGLAARSIQPR